MDETREPMRRVVRRGGGIAAATLLLLALAAPSAARAQEPEDSVTLAAGARYRARSSLHAALLGSRYRDLWITPVTVPVLDLSAVAGGLVPVETGGHKQTRSLRFRASDGREYNFRSVDKEITAGLPDFLQETAVDRVLQDLTSAQLPSAPLVATALVDRAGILHPGPELFVLPDDPALAEYRDEFAGMLGTLEVHANEGENDEPLFAGAARVAGTDRLLEHLEEGPDDRVDALAFLRARLLDALLGDFDRHGGQWRWARYDRDGVHWWSPVPEDRDYAFVDYDGILPALARASVARRLIRFQERFPNLLALMDNSLDLNRRLLSEPTAAQWDSAAAALQAVLTDEVIEDAVRRMPPPHFERSGPELIRRLVARRDGLRDLAREYYHLLAENVEVRATDEDDRAEIVRGAGGSVEVRLSTRDGGVPYFERTFLPEETDEIRVFLHGGDDRARVSGGGGDVVVRVIGGGGDDLLEDEAAGRTILYDSRGDNVFRTGPSTRVVRREHEDPPEDDGVLPSSARDWGESRSLFAPTIDWMPHAELVVGGGPSWTRFGFRRHPYAWRGELRGLYAPLHGRFGAEVEGDFHAESSPRALSLLARATGLEATPFHGYGNDSPRRPLERARIWHERYLADARLRVPLSPRLEVTAGGVARHTRSSVPEDSPLAILGAAGTGPVSQLGAVAGLRLGRQAEDGVALEIDGAAYPAVWGSSGAYGRATGRAEGSRTLPWMGGTVLAARMGGSAAVGDHPFFDAAFLGGWDSLRGYHFQRFAGDAALFGGAEVRVPISPVELLVRGTLGVSLFADAGRVFVDGESADGWHGATGASLWFATPLGDAAVSYATGEENRFYVRIGGGLGGTGGR